MLPQLMPAVAGGMRVRSIDQDGLEDRAYRLHYNKGQNRTDLFAQVQVSQAYNPNMKQIS
jgi:hypothetical protein